MRIQAIRASETLFKAGDRSFAADYTRLTKDSSVDVVDPGPADDEPMEGAGCGGDHHRDDGRAIRRVASSSSATTLLKPPAGEAGAADAARRRPRPSSRAPRARRAGLQRDVLRLSWPRRARHAETRARDDDGAGAGRIAARERAPRLHRQGRAARGHRPGGREDLHRHDDPDGQLRRRVDRRRELGTSAPTSATAAAS